MSSQPVSYVSPEEYLEFERKAETKHEYVCGEILDMAGGTPQHGYIATNIATALVQLLNSRNCWVFNSDVRVSVRWGELITYPDVSVVCGQPKYTDERRDTLTNPILIAEVLSPSTRNFDRGDKSRLYRMLPSLSEFILVEQAPTEVEHWRRLSSGSWEVSAITDRHASLHLVSLSCDLSIEAVYRNVEGLSA